MKKMGFPLLALWLGLGCGGGPVSNPNPPPLVVSISPPSGAVLTGGGVQFSSNMAVDWQVNGQRGGNSLFGTISSSGFYIAPFNVPNPNVVTITAVSQADLSKSASASLSISSNGPVWHNLGPFGGFAPSFGSALAIDPLNPSTLYVNCSENVCKSIDGGRSWHLSNTGLPALTTGDLAPLLAFAIDPLTSTTVYIAAPVGVFKSVDGGATWSATNNGFGGGSAVVLAIDDKNPATVFAGTGKGVFKTSDGGNSWSPMNRGLPLSSNGLFTVNALAVNPVTTSTIFAGTEDAVFKSTDGASTWNLSGLQRLQVTALAIDPKAPATIYAGTLNLAAAVPGAIFKSVDNGNSWVATGTLPNLGGPHEIRTIAVDPVNDLTVYAGANVAGVYKSTDGGANWQLSSNGMRAIPDVEPAISGFAIDPQSPSIIYAATDTDGIGVYKSIDDGMSWNVSNTGLPGIFATAFNLDPQTPTILYASTSAGAFKSTNQGSSWQAIDFGLNGDGLLVDPITTSTIYSFSQTGVFKSTDGGLTSSAVLGGGPGIVNTFLVFMLAMDPTVSTTLYEADGGPDSSGPFSHKTVNGGQTWSESLCVKGISSLVIAHGNSSIVYLVNEIGTSTSGRVTDLLKSQDGGTTCNHAGNGLPSDPVDALLIDPATKLVVYAGMDSQGIFKTTDGGASWNASNTGIEHRQVVKLAIDPRSSTIVYAATGDGAVFKTTNGGALWTSVSTGLPGGRIHALVIDPLTSTILYVATNRGVFVLHQ